MGLSSLFQKLESILFLLSSVQLAIIYLIVLPSAMVISHYLLTEVVISYFKSISTVDTITQNLEYAKLSVNIFSIYQIMAFSFVFVTYPPYPFPFSIEKYFLKRGYESAVSEFEFLKKTLYICVPLLIFSIVIDYILPLDQLLSSNIIIFYSVRGFLVFTVGGGTLRMIFILFRRRYGLYIAKGYISLLNTSNDEGEKIGYLIAGLNWYNSYLKRYIKLEIHQISKIYSKIASLPSKDKNDTLSRIVQSFNSDDSLEPMRYLSSFKDPNIDAFLTEERILDKIKLQVTFAVGIIPVILTSIEILLTGGTSFGK